MDEMVAQPGDFDEMMNEVVDELVDEMVDGVAAHDYAMPEEPTRDNIIVLIGDAIVPHVHRVQAILAANDSILKENMKAFNRKLQNFSHRMYAFNVKCKSTVAIKKDLEGGYAHLELKIQILEEKLDRLQSGVENHHECLKNHTECLDTVHECLINHTECLDTVDKSLDTVGCSARTSRASNPCCK
jgi:hypothetical protein